MNSTRKMAVLALGLLASVACNNSTNLPPAPAPPKQIGTSVSYTKTVNSKGETTGLPSNEVYSFLTISTGEFWVGTNAGVARFANINTNTLGPGDIVNEISGLPHPEVRCMAEYSGRVFVGTWGGGIGVYNIANNSWAQIRPGTTGLVDGFISGMAVSPDEDRIYFSTNNGVSIYDPTAHTFKHFTTEDPFLLAIPDELLTDAQRTVLVLERLVSSVAISEDSGVIERWYGPRIESTIDAGLLAYVGIVVSKDSLSVNDPVVSYRNSTVNSGLADANVDDIFYDTATKTFWVSYVTRGVAQVSVADKTWKNYGLPQGLPSNTVYSVTRASNGAGGTTMWAATQGGLAKLVNDHWESYGKSGGLPSDRVRRVYSDDGLHLWAGFVDRGAVKIKI